MPHSPLDAATTTRLSLREQVLATWPELAGDSDTLNDSLAGLDTLEEQIVATMRHVLEREAHAKGIGDYIEALTARKKRLEDGAKWLRAAVLHAMTEAKLPKLKAPDFSLSVGAGKPRLVIADSDAVPEALCRVKREPDMAAIREWLAELDGPGMPNWAKWEDARRFLSVHRR